MNKFSWIYSRKDKRFYEIKRNKFQIIAENPGLNLIKLQNFHNRRFTVDLKWDDIETKSRVDKVVPVAQYNALRQQLTDISFRYDRTIDNLHYENRQLRNQIRNPQNPLKNHNYAKRKPNSNHRY